MKILGPARMWSLPWWNKNVTSPFTKEELEGKIPRPSDVKLAWRMARMQHKFDIVCFGGSINLFYCLFVILFPLKRASVVMGEMFFPDNVILDWKWRLKRSIRRFLFRKVDKFIVYSTAEKRLWAEYLNLPEARFEVILFASNVLQPGEHPQGCYCNERSYGFAAGRSGRDYKTFFDAVRDIPFPFVAVSDKASVEGLEVPKNVTLHCDIPRERYLELLKRAAFTVVPLYDLKRSTGQVVILEGYAYGKPTVASRVIGTVDYVIDGKTGYLVSPSSPQEMREAIQKLIDSPELCETMGGDSLEHVLAHHSPSTYLETYKRILMNVYENRD